MWVCVQVCRARQGAGHTDADHTFQVPYDILLLAVRRAGWPAAPTSCVLLLPVMLPHNRGAPTSLYLMTCWDESSPDCLVHGPCAHVPQVGSVNNTFGVKGVKENCWFLKTIDEAHKLRVHLRWLLEAR
jgi:hypothetical protein